jgi:hypothetical protein
LGKAWATSGSKSTKFVSSTKPANDLRFLTHAEERVTALLRAYLELHRNQIQPQNINLAVLIVERTVEALTHTAVIDRPELLSDGQLEQEITNLLLSYLVEKKPQDREHARANRAGCPLHRIGQRLLITSSSVVFA